MTRHYNGKWSSNSQLKEHLIRLYSSNVYKNAREVYSLAKQTFPDLSLASFYRVYNNLNKETTSYPFKLLDLLLSSPFLFTSNEIISLDQLKPLQNHTYISAEANVSINNTSFYSSFLLCSESTIVTKNLITEACKEASLLYDYLFIIGFESSFSSFLKSTWSTSLPFRFLNANPYLFTGVHYFYKQETSSPFHYSVSIDNLDLTNCVEVLRNLPTKLEVDTKTQLLCSLSSYLNKPIDYNQNDFINESIRLSCELIDAFNYDIPFFAVCLASSQYYLPYFFDELLKLVEGNSIKALNLVESSFCSVFNSYQEWVKTWYSAKVSPEKSFVYGIDMPGKGIAIFDISIDFFH